MTIINKFGTASKHQSLLLAMTLLFSLFASTNLYAVPISLFGTGLDGSGNLLAGGAPDPHYSVIENGGAPAIVRTGLPGTYFPNDTNSQWIWQQAVGFPINTVRTFRTTFDLTGLDPTTAVINGAWGTDNEGLDILINGISTGNQLLGVIVQNFNQLHAWTITSGFQSGINTLDFVISDSGFVAAFRTELSGTADTIAVPEPSSLALLSAGLIGLFIRRRRAA